MEISQELAAELDVLAVEAVIKGELACCSTLVTLTAIDLRTRDKESAKELFSAAERRLAGLSIALWVSPWSVDVTEFREEMLELSALLDQLKPDILNPEEAAKP